MQFNYECRDPKIPCEPDHEGHISEPKPAHIYQRLSSPEQRSEHSTCGSACVALYKLCVTVYYIHTVQRVFAGSRYSVCV